MSPIQDLTNRAHDLSNSLDRWNFWYLVLVGITVVLAGATFITQFVAMAKGKKLSTVQTELLAAKDAESGEKLGKLTVQAKQAEDGIAIAQADAAKANLLAEQEKLARVKIEEKMAPRTL